MRRMATHGGMELAVELGGHPSHHPIIFLHGGGQTRHSWNKATSVLNACGYHTWNVDLRGHGDSGWAADGDYSLASQAADVRALAKKLDQKPVLVGASLGGLASLMAAGNHPEELISALVLVDVVPTLGAAGREEVQGFMTAAPDGFASLEAAADAVAAYLPHRPRPKSLDGLRKNLRQRKDGRWVWHWDPAFIGGMARGGEGDLPKDELDRAAARITAPTLLIRGSKSKIVTDEGVRDFQRLIPHAEYVNVADADHMVAGDKNDDFNAPLIEFLERRVRVVA